jgi:hypothetical protein
MIFKNTGFFRRTKSFVMLMSWQRGQAHSFLETTPFQCTTEPFRFYLNSAPSKDLSISSEGGFPAMETKSRGEINGMKKGGE